MRTVKPPRLYFSFRSPYSWLAIHRLRAQVPDLFTAFELIPYWDPDALTHKGLHEVDAGFHYVQMSRAKHLYILSDTKRIAADLGLQMRWPIDVDPWWEPAHLGWLLARDLGVAEAYYDAVTAARWGRGANIWEPDVLAAAADTAGVPAGDISAAADRTDVRARGVECLRLAYLDDIFGIPYIKWGHERFWGLDRVDVFLNRWNERRPVPAGIGPVIPMTTSYDTDTAGGCG